jgi:hypothetical protein
MAGQLTIDTLKASSGVLATQNGMTGIAKAWCQFGGTTPTLNGSFNISSITKNGTGDYTFNFTTAMPNANYAFVGSASINLSTSGYTSFFPNSIVGSPYYQAPTTTNCRATLSYSASGAQASDVNYASMAIFSS